MAKVSREFSIQGKMMSGIDMNQKYQRMEMASNVLSYVPWIIAALAFAVTGSLPISLVLLTPFGFTVSVLAVILGHVVRYKIRKSSKDEFAHWEPSISGLVSGYLGISVALAFFLWFPYGDPLRGKEANEASAIGSLRSIQLAANGYKTAHPANGFPVALAELSSYSDDLLGVRIDSQIIDGQKSGYRFTYVTRKGKDGRVDSYELFADPIKEGVTGTRHFFVDQSGILRSATKMQATSESATIH
jgi:hypothetical protein